ncbi:hypothetical protein PFISCL1PPCAC_7925, partial [Pristionchus fissidentatus]
LHLLDGDIYVLLLLADPFERARVDGTEGATSQFIADVDVLVDEVIVGPLHGTFEERPRHVAVLRRLAHVVLDQRHQRCPIHAVVERPEAVLVVDA